MDKQPVICPWCGSDACEKAYKLAINRPLQKPLTLEEVKQECAVWAEYKSVDEEIHLQPVLLKHVVDDKKMIFIYWDTELFEISRSSAGLLGYGSIWRCWAMKPTDEEREAAKWEA